MSPGAQPPLCCSPATDSGQGTSLPSWAPEDRRPLTRKPSGLHSIIYAQSWVAYAAHGKLSNLSRHYHNSDYYLKTSVQAKASAAVLGQPEPRKLAILTSHSLAHGLNRGSPRGLREGRDPPWPQGPVSLGNQQECDGPAGGALLQ